MGSHFGRCVKYGSCGLKHVTELGETDIIKKLLSWPWRNMIIKCFNWPFLFHIEMWNFLFIHPTFYILWTVFSTGCLCKELNSQVLSGMLTFDSVSFISHLPMNTSSSFVPKILLVCMFAERKLEKEKQVKERKTHDSLATINRCVNIAVLRRTLHNNGFLECVSVVSLARCWTIKLCLSPAISKLLCEHQSLM